MIQNWSTIEKIAKRIRALREFAAIAKKHDFYWDKADMEREARKWEALLRKFADSCNMVEIFTVSPKVTGDNLQYYTRPIRYIHAISADAALQIWKQISKLDTWEVTGTVPN